MSFIFYKDGSEIVFSDKFWVNSGVSVVYFLIISVGIGDGGNYSCRYYDFVFWFEFSDFVEFVVIG